MEFVGFLTKAVFHETDQTAIFGSLVPAPVLVRCALVLSHSKIWRAIPSPLRAAFDGPWHAMPPPIIDCSCHCYVVEASSTRRYQCARLLPLLFQSPSAHCANFSLVHRAGKGQQQCVVIPERSQISLSLPMVPVHCTSRRNFTENCS